MIFLWASCMCAAHKAKSPRALLMLKFSFAAMLSCFGQHTGETTKPWMNGVLPQAEEQDLSYRDTLLSPFTVKNYRPLIYPHITHPFKPAGCTVFFTSSRSFFFSAFPQGLRERVFGGRLKHHGVLPASPQLCKRPVPAGGSKAEAQRD